MELDPIVQMLRIVSSWLRMNNAHCLHLREVMNVRLLPKPEPYRL